MVYMATYEPITEIGGGIYVKDIVVSDKVEILDDMGEMIVMATSTYEEPEEEEVVIEGELEEPDVIEKGKKEEGEEETED